MTALRECRTDAQIGASFCALSSVIIGLGVLLGLAFFRAPRAAEQATADPWSACCRNDGTNYRAIVVGGYAYDPGARSMVAFFPLYPLLARGVAAVGVRPEAALLLVSNVALVLAFIVFHRYARLRHPEPDSPVPLYAVAALALFPPTMFFHMAYSEALFLGLTGLTLLAVQRDRHPLVVALLAGAATAVRPVGVALVPVVLLYLWRRSPTTRSFCARAAWLAPLSCGGLLLYMAYQQFAFGEPFAFALTQQHWSVYPDRGLADRAVSLLTLEPVRGVYDPSSPRYWGALDRAHEPVFSLIFWNPIVFVAAVLTTIVGGTLRLLNAYEVTLSAGLLLIPYVTRSYDFSMLSMARFSAAVLPCYLVWGVLAAALPRPVLVGCAALGGFFLGVFAALFAAGWRFI